jgi:hypothetical protein
MLAGVRQSRPTRRTDYQKVISMFISTSSRPVIKQCEYVSAHHGSSVKTRRELVSLYYLGDNMLAPAPCAPCIHDSTVGVSQSGDELSSIAHASLPPQGLYALLSRAGGDVARLCPPVRSIYRHLVRSGSQVKGFIVPIGSWSAIVFHENVAEKQVW